MPPVQAVLICEDDPINARVLSAAIEARGHKVVGPCTTAAEAAEMAGIADIAAAILDVSLDLEGTTEEAAHKLAARGIPFAFITGYGPQTAGVLRQFTDHLAIPKPVDLETLDLILDTLLGDQRQAITA